MRRKNFLILLCFILLNFNICLASDFVIQTSEDDESWSLGIVADDSGKYFFSVYNSITSQIALIPYERELYNFYLTKGTYGYGPLIFLMIISNSPDDVDTDFGEWEDGIHILPVYALFDYDGENITLTSYLSSGSGLNPSHYQGRIESPYHQKLAEIFLTRMPDLHLAVEENNIFLP